MTIAALIILACLFVMFTRDAAITTIEFVRGQHRGQRSSFQKLERL